MMDRRSFMATLGGLGTLAPVGMAGPAGEKRRVFTLEQYFLKNGSQVQRIHDHIGKAALPALSRYHSGPKIVLEALVAPHQPQLAVILGFESVEELWSVRAKVVADPELAKSYEAWESHPEQPYEHFSTALLEATDYMPELVNDRETRKSSRVFELRVYHSPTWRQLRALHERFAGPEIKIFHRVGVNPILYTSTIIGPNMPNLTYLTPFDDLASREKAWNAFSADPEWARVRKESIDRHGQISSVIQIALYRATAYSPIR
ncbi:MAG: NIPSNAP family protein [Acidobacteria bacterium]|nr:NIPSNAP family protein [Acidobacteriota bacterium]